MTMTTTIDALVEALENILSVERTAINDSDAWTEIKVTARAALALARACAEQAKPVGVVSAWPDEVDWTGEKPPRGTQLFTTPPAAPVAKLKPLTGREVGQIAAKTLGEMHVQYCGLEDLIEFAQELTAAHNAKLGGAG